MQLSLIISREYLERVKRKSFIITTLLVPVLMFGLMAAPALMMMLSEPERTEVMVCDATERIAPLLHGNGDVNFTVTDADAAALRSNPDVQAYIIIGADAISRPERDITVYTRGSLSMMTDTYITSQLNRAVEDVRLEAYNIGDIRRILDEVQVDCTYHTVNIEGESDTSTSSTLSYIIALTTDMLLYMFILIYGQMVMTSIIEEKTNRVLEIVVSSVKPRVLMLGKILGIGLVAVTQILIWGVLLGSASAWLMPSLGLASDAATEPELASAIALLGDPSYVFGIFGWMLLFFIGGYLFYSAIFAAIGSAVDNIQDAGQLSSVATVPVIIGIIASMAVINNPGSTLAFWLGLIPLTSPMCMMARLPFGVPVWEILLSLAVLYASFMFMIWLCAKIYRVGIFMYGKKPTLLEIIRWSRY